MLSDVTKSAIAVSVTVLGSVFLVCGCLYLRRYKRNKRNASNPEKSNSESAVKNEQGITNTACDDVYESVDIYETCKECDIYDYATVERPNRKRFKTVQEDGTDLENNSPDCEDGRVYDVLEAPSEEAVTSDPIYFTLERGSHQAPDVEPRNEEYSGNQDDIGMDEDTYVINIPDDVYDNEETRDDKGSENEGSHGIGGVTEELDDDWESESQTVVSGGSKDNEGYTGDEVLYENVHKQVKRIDEAFEEEIYVIGNDEVEDERYDHGNDDDNHDHDHDENPDDEIYENWENETIARKSQVCDDGLYWNEENDTTEERRFNHDNYDETNHHDQDSGVDSMYENLTDFRNSLHGSIEKIVTEVA